MAQPTDRIAEIETLVEATLWDHEARGDLESAATVYQRAIAELGELPVDTAAARHSRDRVLAYTLMRHANVLRQAGDIDAAFARCRDRTGLAAVPPRVRAALARLVQKRVGPIRSQFGIEGPEHTEQS